MIENKAELSSFINKKRKLKITPIHTVALDDKPLPWYKRPLDESEFFHKISKNGDYYVKHKEWSKKIWIGPYKNLEDVKFIINSYIVESLKTSLERKVDSKVHSIIIDNEEEFFMK